MGSSSSSSSLDSSEESSIKRLVGRVLAEDIWYEIFLRLPLTSIFIFKSVSKVWLSALSSPNFMNQWYKLNNTLLPWGLVHYNPAVESQDRVTREFTVAYPEYHSQSIETHQSGLFLSTLNPIFPDDNDQKRMRLFLLGSSKGLVLCYADLGNQITYYVCNPLTKKWVLLPPPLTKKKELCVIGIICIETFSQSTSYKVIRVPSYVAAANEIKVEIFSSELGEWNIFGVSCPQGVTWEAIFPLDNILSHDGVFYWFQRRNNKILTFNVNKTTSGDSCGDECRLINLPVLGEMGGYCGNQCIGESEGLICFARIKDTERSLSVWVLEEDWRLLHKDIKFHDILAEIESWLLCEATTDDLITNVQVVGFDPTDRNVVLVNYKKCVVAYNACTRKYEKLCYPSSLGSNSSLMAFVFKPRPTVLPSVSWSGTSILDVRI